MSENEKKSNQKQDNASTDVGQQQVQSAFDEANAKGYFGTVPDETPNEAYTVAGVTKAAKEKGDGK